MLIGTNRGLYYLDPGTNLVKKHPLSGSLTGNEIKTMYEDRHHNLWIGTSQGLNKVPFRQAGSKVQHFKNGNGPGTLPGDYITSITEDKEGFIWIGTHHNGLCRFNPGDASFSPLAALAEDEHVRKIFVDDKNIF
ncbi:two-component regulator propeller domain-containing protein [Niabella hibiscisoli]|uniref:two-component regulator propeller domain-containing protein n=1 Tax=Niabella hibiscisoli TaxID=1825928 RepID=UPI001F0F6927|nr:two-component regulator propeller domain-containing protein [Niabella hibiscisoli]MCH5718372.1 hypothetical protein [Niabella hibiscisoli]